MAILDIFDPHRCALGEGPVWNKESREVAWIDITGGVIHQKGYEGERSTITLPSSVGAIARTTRQTWLVCLADSIIELDGEVQRQIAAYPSIPDRSMRSNDAAVDPEGRLLASTMADDAAERAGALYRLEPGGTLTTVIAATTISNGIGWSTGGDRMYYVDSATRRIDVFDYDSGTGTPTNRAPFVHIPQERGTPDGLTVDADGCVWVALWGGGAVLRFDDEGRAVGSIEVPTRNTTSCAFVGDTREDLVITSAADPSNPDDGLAGATFIASDLGTRGQSIPLVAM